MANNWDASIKLLSPVDLSTNFTVDTIKPGASFDVQANVEIGSQIFQFATGYKLRIWVRNVSTFTLVAAKTIAGSLTGSPTPYNAVLTVNIPPTWTASPGDVLDVLASYEMDAVSQSDYSMATSGQFVVVA